MSIKLSEYTFNNIIHLSDINIADKDRIEEYDKVFNNLFKSISSLKENAIIVITGIIYYDKKYINYFIRLSELYPLVVSSNILPIGIPNIYHLDEFKTYEFGNIILTMSSTMNKAIKRDQILSDKRCLLIYNNQKFDNIDDYSNYDAILLGNINQQKKVLENAYYPGSLIQYDHTTVYSNNGYLLWDISMNKPKISFNIVNNDYGHILLNIEDNLWKNTTIEFPNISRVVCHISNTTINRTVEIINTIRANHNIIEYKIINIKPVDYTHNLLLSNLPDNLKEIHANHILDKKQWYPLKMKFKNLFCYCNNVVNNIEFDKGLNILVGQKSTGKSSIINILLYGLFGTLISKNVQNIDILNFSENKGYLKLIVQYGSTIYKIVRELTRHPNSKKNPVVSKCKISYINSNNKIRILEGQLASDELYKIFGNIEDFYRNNMINNKDKSIDFFNLTNDNRSKYLTDLLKGQIFDSNIDDNSNNIDYITKVKDKDFQNVVLKNALSNIEKECNTKLSEYIDKHIVFEYCNETIKVEIYNGNNKIKYSNLSSYESFIVSLVFKLSLSDYSNSSIFIVDDNIGLKSITDFILTKYSCLLCTSTEYIPDITNKSIIIKRDNIPIIY